MAQAQEIQQALAAHERIRKSTDLPLFYGNKEKDVIDPHDFLDRFETAAQIANWVPVPAQGQAPNTARKCQEFYMLLRHDAVSWWVGLEDMPDCDRTVWDNVKREFVTTYAPRYTARTACMSLGDLVQKHGESVAAFYLRVSKAYRLLKRTRPDAMFQVVAPLPNLDVDLAPRNAAATQYATDVILEGIDKMGRYMMQQIFTAGLLEDIRIKTMEAENVDSWATAYRKALSVETILKDKRGSKPLVSAIRDTDENREEEDPEIEEDEEELLADINAIRRTRGKKPIRFAPRNSKGSFHKKTASITCRYCKKNGHFQRKCMKRKRENGAMVDQFGKPFKIAQVEDEEEETYEEDQEEEDQQVASITSALSGFYGINSITEVGDSEEEEQNVLLERAEWLEDIGEYPTENTLSLHLEEEGYEPTTPSSAVPHRLAILARALIQGALANLNSQEDRHALLYQYRYYALCGKWPVESSTQTPKTITFDWNDENGPHPWVSFWESKYSNRQCYIKDEVLEDLKYLFGQDRSYEYPYEERQHQDWELSYLDNYEFVEPRGRHYSVPIPDSYRCDLTWFYQHLHLLTPWQRAVLRRISHYNGSKYLRIPKGTRNNSRQRLHDFLATILIQEGELPNEEEYDLYHLYADIYDNRPMTHEEIHEDAQKHVDRIFGITSKPEN